MFQDGRCDGSSSHLVSFSYINPFHILSSRLNFFYSHLESSPIKWIISLFFLTRSTIKNTFVVGLIERY